MKAGKVEAVVQGKPGRVSAVVPSDRPPAGKDVFPPLDRIVGDHFAIDPVVHEITDLVRKAYYAREDAHPEGVRVRVFVEERTETD